jgi:hypothetical protein
MFRLKFVNFYLKSNKRDTTHNILAIMLATDKEEQL